MIKNALDPRSFVIKTKSQISEWVEDFENLRVKILASSDKRKKNYSFEKFNLKEQEEITVIYFSGKIIAFSSLYYRNYYPNNTSRVLNRTWKSPQIRGINQSYWLLSKYMLAIQLKKAILLKKQAIFISVEGKKNRWLSRFITEAKKEEPGWVYLPDKYYKVAPGKDISCWQLVAYLPFKRNYTLSFPSLKSEEYQNNFSH